VGLGDSRRKERLEHFFSFPPSFGVWSWWWLSFCDSRFTHVAPELTRDSGQSLPSLTCQAWRCRGRVWNFVLLLVSECRQLSFVPLTLPSPLPAKSFHLNHIQWIIFPSRTCVILVNCRITADSQPPALLCCLRWYMLCRPHGMMHVVSYCYCPR
jgi:hypothetical protein